MSLHLLWLLTLQECVKQCSDYVSVLGMLIRIPLSRWASDVSRLRLGNHCGQLMSVYMCVIINLLKGSTKAYARNGYQLNSFPSCLPGGCRHCRGYSRSGNETTSPRIFQFVLVSLGSRLLACDVIVCLYCHFPYSNDVIDNY